VNQQIGVSVMRAYRRGHPAPKSYYVAMMAVWGFIAYSGATGDGVVNKITAIGAAVFFALDGFTLSQWRLRCRLYHAAEAVVIECLKAYELTDEQEKEIMEARRA
jgi:hypothetical protein